MPPVPRSICVFSSSSDEVDARFFEAARRLGEWIGQGGHTLVYGGGNVGTMGELARSTHRAGGKVVGIIPGGLHSRTCALDCEHELVVVEDMRERKTLMELRSQAFVALPGGFGTLEELLEILTLKQLKFHAKPIAILNLHGFYDTLITLFDEFYEKKFAKRKDPPLYEVVTDVPSLTAFLKKNLR